MCSFHNQGKAGLSELWRATPDDHLPNSKKRVWKLPHYKVYSTQWTNSNPNVIMLWKATLAFTHLWFSKTNCKWAKGLPNALHALVAFREFPRLEKNSRKCSPVGINLIWCEKQHPESKGLSAPEGNLRVFTKEDSGSFLLAKYILLCEHTPSPMWVCSRK